MEATLTPTPDRDLCMRACWIPNEAQKEKCRTNPAGENRAIKVIERKTRMTLCYPSWFYRWNIVLCIKEPASVHRSRATSVNTSENSSSKFKSHFLQNQRSEKRCAEINFSSDNINIENCTSMIHFESENPAQTATSMARVWTTCFRFRGKTSNAIAPAHLARSNRKSHSEDVHAPSEGHMKIDLSGPGGSRFRFPEESRPRRESRSGFLSVSHRELRTMAQGNMAFIMRDGFVG